MKEYKDALLTWFLNNAKMYGIHGEEWVSKEVIKHLRECGLSNDTDMPEMGTVEQFAGTFVPNEQIGAVVVEHWGCKCGKYTAGDHIKFPHPINGYGPGYVYMERLAVLGEITLSNVIKDVIEAGRDDA